jgi:dTDP-glucose 4,6-dehydratase
MILSLTNSKSKIVFKELPVDDPKVRQPDISKAMSLLHWEPRVSRDIGLQKTLKYFQDTLNKNK